ncbi:MAG: NTP transferase domain-containing protein, partial [Candidatus Omnitrophica bacterium]|nr:NTP transferase domain-containing protein [Candidatus Omnitrophota bacterium]
MRSELPKVLHEVCGKPVVEYVVDVAQSVGSLKTYVVVGYKGKLVKARLGFGVVTVDQPRLAGTADAVRRVERHLKSYRGDVLILCGDTPLLNKTVVKDLVRKHKQTGAACTFLTAVVPDPRGYGRVIRDDRGVAVAIREEKDASENERGIAEINVGVYCVRSRELWKALRGVRLNPEKKEFYLTDIIDLFHQDGSRVETVSTEDPVEGLGVNTKEDLAVAERVIREKILNNFMRDGVTIVDPATTYIDADVKIGKDTRIRPFTVIEKDVRIGDRCVIGPFARLRPGTRIGNEVEVG